MKRPLTPKRQQAILTNPRLLTPKSLANHRAETLIQAVTNPANTVHATIIQALTNPANTVYATTRFIGKRRQDAATLKSMTFTQKPRKCLKH